MKKLTALVLPMLVFAACSVSLNAPSITDLKLCSQITGDLCSSDSTTFQPVETSLYATAIYNYAEANESVKVTWNYVGGNPDIQGPLEIASADIKIPEGTVFNMKGTIEQQGPWPTGNYEVVLTTVSGKVAALKKSFSVQ
ncbi:hypothetical protein HZA38_04125 [Candidatus Peregrinibacteria bacterium]|nr:hypothetical protein [Candidatus Peregrinibacteria bacterium]